MSLSGGVVDISPLLTLTLLTSLSLLPLLTLRLTERRPNIRNITRPGLSHCRIISGVFSRSSQVAAQCLAVSPHNSLDCQELEEVSHVARAVCLTPSTARPAPVFTRWWWWWWGETVRTVGLTRETFPDYFPVIFSVSARAPHKQWPDLRAVQY